MYSIYFSMASAVVAAALSVTASASNQAIDSAGASFALDDVRGQYQLSDGRMLSVAGTQRRPTAQIDQGIAMPLRAQSHLRWATSDGKLHFTFDAARNGGVYAVRIDQPQRL